ncbi:MAG: hypothetical protein ACLU4N_02100 [Butyricimonas faecihominis]
MRTSKIILGVLVLSGMFCQVQAQKVKMTEGKKNASFEGWHLRSYETDGVYGAGVNQAYEYLKDRKPKARTVVGIVDGGVDVTHEDLKDVLWRNPERFRAMGLMMTGMVTWMTHTVEFSGYARWETDGDRVHDGGSRIYAVEEV